MKTGKNALTLALEEARKLGYSSDLIERVEQRGMLDGSFELTYQGAERIYKRMQELVVGRGKAFGKDYLSILERFDPVRDSDLIATGLFCLVPEVREKVSKDLGSLYKVVLSVGTNRHKGHALSERQERKPVSQKNFFPSHLRDLLAALPKPESDQDKEYQRMLHVLVQKKAERDVFPAFKHGEVAALRTLDQLVSRETDENVRQAYQELANTYRGYLDFKLIGVNPSFVDPETGEKGVLPSLHQKIGVYHLLTERRFGIWDGGGTGKTAIAVLAQPMIEEALLKEGKEFRRAVIVGPNLSKKAWKRGLLGSRKERYLAEEQDALIINGERKDEAFLDELATKKWIVMNYEQLTTSLNGSKKLFIDSLVELGVDYVVFDESHNIKALRETTTTGKPSHSAAARILALNADYFTPMSATPISNGLMDFAVLYHLLNPVALRDPEKFAELIQNSPRVLYTFFNERSVRRTSEDINEDLDWAENEHSISLDPVQKAIYEHIVEFRPANWLQQARKALLDPRLVDPDILEGAGMLGKVSLKNSAKYKKLEELLTATDGPIATGEQFIVFSTMFREGVTQPGHEGLRKRYAEKGLSKEYEKLQLDVTLKEVIENSVRKKYGADVEVGIIDGTIANIEDRERVVESLKDGLVGIICTTETGGESLDFTEANHAYFLDEDYVPDTEQQALWRLLRKGQKKKVMVNHLRAEGTLDEYNRDYVDKKRIIAKMAMDGHPPTEDEWSLLGDTEGRSFGDLIKRSIGGVSIDVYKAEVAGISDFEMKKRISSSRTGTIIPSSIYSTTDAQRVMAWIGKDPLGCWQDPAFVTLYLETLKNLSPHVVHTAKICDLISRANSGEIEFPKNIVSEGSGPSLLYNSYRTLGPILKAHGLKNPKIVDRDTSQLMLNAGANPHQVLASMTGENSPFKKGQFDMVDNESLSLLR
ncbi:MAG: DEAD/DEAH box helicase, partial [Patescibacteria group bacterium]